MKYLAQPQTYKCKKLINHFLQLKWLMVALVVGSILNLINQYEAIISEQSIQYSKVALTYLVPYFVSSVSAWHSMKANTKYVVK